MSLVQTEATSGKEDLLMNRSRARARLLKLAQCQVFAVIYCVTSIIVSGLI